MSPQGLRDDLRRALELGDHAAVRAILAREPAARELLDAPLFPFDTPALVHFTSHGDLDTVELLLELGADPNRKTDWWAGGFHALYWARGPIAERLLEAGAVPDVCAAANLDRPDLIARMLAETPRRVHERGGDGQTPLHFARSPEVADLLLERGADIDARDVDHRSTPAQWMLDRKRGAGRYALAEHLVQRGASVDVFLAAALGMAARLREMLQADATLVELRTGRGPYGERPPGSFHIYTWTLGQHLSPLQVAAQFGQDDALDVMRALASPKARLLAACVRGDGDEAERILRERPGIMDELTPDDRRALPDAAWIGNGPGVALMLRLGFDPAEGGDNGATALHNAAWQGSVDCVEAILRHVRGSDGKAPAALVEAREPTFGGTPLGWCCHGSRHGRNPVGDYPGVARLLLEAGAQVEPEPVDASEAVLAVLRERRR